MSLLSALFKARTRPDDTAPKPEPAGDSPAADTPARQAQDNVFELVPPEKTQEAVREPRPEPEPEPKKKGRNVHNLAVADLSRLSIDDDGRLYWDGKPVEVRRRIQMSRAQVVGASFVAAFIVIGAIGAAVQGSLALRDWSCRLGWTTRHCTLPGTVPSPLERRPLDIPA
jgi:hypothetical protein